MTSIRPLFSLSRCITSRLYPIRSFASKKDDVYKIEMPKEDGKGKEGESKPRKKTLEFKQKVYLLDINGKNLGLKTRQEAAQIASKNNWILVDGDLSSKVPTLKLVDARQKLAEEAQVDESSLGVDQSSPKNRKAAVKQMLFSAKLSEHDLETKINQIKKWVARGQSTMVRINSHNANDFDKLKQIDQRFDEVFNKPDSCGTKINQKRLTAQELKLNVVPVDLQLAKQLLDNSKEGQSDGSEPVLDPNILLSEELKK